jgi:hypothetical protein
VDFNFVSFSIIIFFNRRESRSDPNTLRSTSRGGIAKQSPGVGERSEKGAQPSFWVLIEGAKQY